MITFITDQRPGEPDILAPVKFSDLLILDLDGRSLASVAAPVGGWTHEILSRQCANLVDDANGVEAFLGDQWVGSTEI